MSEDREKESIFRQMEHAIIDALREESGADAEVEVAIDRVSGTISATVDGLPISMSALGCIAARSGKKVLEKCIDQASDP